MSKSRKEMIDDKRMEYAKNYIAQLNKLKVARARDLQRLVRSSGESTASKKASQSAQSGL